VWIFGDGKHYEKVPQFGICFSGNSGEKCCNFVLFRTETVVKSGNFIFFDRAKSMKKCGNSVFLMGKSVKKSVNFVVLRPDTV
jgi:hypothetical protein